jgi:tripartite ATP-independent transporter DctM subunit
MSGETLGLLGVLLFFALIALRMPIAYAMCITGFLGYSAVVGPGPALSLVGMDIYASFTSTSLSVIVMFVWMGFIAYYAGVGTKLYLFADRMVGHKPGGLAVATQFACAMFGAICGSNTATAATMGAIALPEMKKYGYNPSLSTASVAAGGALGILIPPSVIMLIYGASTAGLPGSPSVRDLFIAGIVPGLLLMLAYIAVILIEVRRKPILGPRTERATRAERFEALGGGLLEILFVFSVSIGGLFLGWFTPTQAGAVGAGAILLIVTVRRQLPWAGFVKSLRDTTRTSAMIMLMVAGAISFGRFIAVSGIPTGLAGWAAGLDLPAPVVMGVILLIYLVLGCFIDALALVLLTIPIFYPVAVNTLGYDPVWFGIIIVMVVAMGVITPPVGMNVFIIKGVAKDVPLETIYRGVWPFLLGLCAVLVLLIAFPDIVTFLPRLLPR